MKLINVIKLKLNNSLLLYAFLAFLLIFIHVNLYQYAFDDPYIHFRVARNFVNTGFPYYNVGESLKVSTSSGWVLVLSSLQLILKGLGYTHFLPIVVSIFNSFVTLLVLLIFKRITEQLLGYSLTILKQLLFFLPVMVVMLPSSIGLMETPLSLLLLGVGILLLMQKKDSGMFPLGLSVYFRLELLLPVALIIAYLFWQRQVSLRGLLFLLLALIPLISFDLYFYRTVIPHSMIAKSKLYTLSFAASTILLIIESFPPLTFFDSNVINGVAFISTMIFTIWILIKNRGISPWILIFQLWSIGISAGYVVQRVQVFEWYRALYLLPLIVACFYFFEVSKNQIIRFQYLFVSTLLSLTLISMLLASFNKYGFFYYYLRGSRVKTYLRVGEILNQAYNSSSLLTSEIGGLGYSFTGTILDAGGLASAAALPFHPMTVPDQRQNSAIGAIPPGFVALTNPEIIVSYDYFAEALLKDEILFNYQLINLPPFLPEDAVNLENELFYKSNYLRVLIRKDLPVPQSLLDLAQQ